MQYYVSWTHSDPIYHASVAGLGVLVSPPNVNLAWTASAWPVPPTRLILDSGAFQYHRERRSPAPATVLERQLAMLGGEATPVEICHLDVPMLGTRSLTELDRRVEQSLGNARWLIQATSERPLPPHVKPIGVIQGYSVERVHTVGLLLAEMGYTTFALGSLAALSASAPDELLRRAEAALEAVGENLHILGVSSVSVLAELARLGVRSADSGSPMHEAWRGGVFYSRPFRRYKLPSAHFQEWRRSYSFAGVLPEPLPCDCPVCREDSARILEPRGKEYVNLRALHNCYHLTQELRAVTGHRGAAHDPLPVA